MKGRTREALLVELDEQCLELLEEEGRLVVSGAGTAPPVVIHLASFVESDGDEFEQDRSVR